MLLGKLGLFILLIFFLISCVDQTQEDCSNDFITSYKNMGDSFNSAYQPYANLSQKNKLIDALSSFLGEHEGKTCVYDGKKISPSKDVSELLESLKKSKGIESRLKLSSKVIYGVDNRLDVSESTSKKHIEWSRSTLAQMEPSRISDKGSIISRTLGESFRLCESERFRDQKNPARCSGFLIGPDTIVTAGHCTQTQAECESMVWVTDFTDGDAIVSKKQIFQCVELISQELSSETLSDYAVIKIDRKITDRKYFRIQDKKTVDPKSELVVIGHPSGLPTKIADGGVVRDNSNAVFFKAALDTYGGNSGSAVINGLSGIVEGVLVRGEVDYVFSSPNVGEDCRVSNVCSINECSGEDVTRMSVVKGIPAPISSKELRDDIFKSKSTPVFSEGWLTSFQGVEKAGVVLGGVQFLDRCGIHQANSNSPLEWKSFFSGKCESIVQIDSIAMDFLSKIYF